MKKPTKRTKKGKGIMDIATPIANRAIAVGKISKGDISGIKSLLPNLSDSMDQLNPLSKDFNQELYNMLTPGEQRQVQFDIMQTKTNPLNIIPFIGLFQDTRESVSELMGMRHPELLKKAVERYNEKIKSDAEMYAEQSKQYEKQEDRKQMEELLNRVIKENKLSPQTQMMNQSYSDIPRTTVPDQSFPIDISRGRGLYSGGCVSGGCVSGGSLYMFGPYEIPYDELYTIKY